MMHYFFFLLILSQIIFFRVLHFLIYIKKLLSRDRGNSISFHFHNAKCSLSSRDSSLHYLLPYSLFHTSYSIFAFAWVELGTSIPCCAIRRQIYPRLSHLHYCYCYYCHNSSPNFHELEMKKRHASE